METRDQWLGRMTDMHGIDAEDILEITELFFDMLEENISNIQASYANGEFHEFVRLVHGIKGAAANIGFEEISSVAANLESQGTNKAVVDLSSQLEQINRYVANRKEFVEI